jgi:hypothetical protein
VAAEEAKAQEENMMAEEEVEVREHLTAQYAARTQATSQKIANITRWRENERER